jgi:hypothetical protein
VAEYWEKTLVAQLEQLGESEVRICFGRGDYGLTGGLKYRVVKDWLDSKESAREVREIELSEDANPIARKVLRGATFANIIAIIVIILIAAAIIIAAIIALPG